MGDQPLKGSFDRISSISTQKDESIKSFGEKIDKSIKDCVETIGEGGVDSTNEEKSHGYEVDQSENLLCNKGIYSLFLS